MFICEHKSANGVLLCTQLNFLCTQEYIMKCCVHKSTRYILLWELWKYSLYVLDILITHDIRSKYHFANSYRYRCAEEKLTNILSTVRTLYIVSLEHPRQIKNATTASIR